MSIVIRGGRLNVASVLDLESAKGLHAHLLVSAEMWLKNYFRYHGIKADFIPPFICRAEYVADLRDAQISEPDNVPDQVLGPQ